MPSPAPSPRAELARAAVIAISAVAGPPAQPVRVVVECDGARIEIAVTPEEAAAVLGPPKVDGLSPVAAAVLAVLTDAPQTAKTLARLAGYQLNPHFRGGIRELERHDPPLCVRRDGGYCRVSATK